MTTLKGIVSAFLSTRRLRNLSPNTITFYSQHLNKFLEFMESNYPDVSLEQIDHTILREYVSRIKESHILAGFLAFIIAFITICFQATKAAIANPADGLRNE